MLRVAICDDNEVHLAYAKSIVERELASWEPEIECFHNAEEFLKSLSFGDYQPEIALLDIEMDGLDGIALARRLNQILPNCAIIFLTAHLRYASSVYEANHVWLVAKTDIESYLPQALKKALELCRTEKTLRQEVLVRCGRRTVAVLLADILYLERFHYRTKLFLANGQELETTQTPSDLLGHDTKNFVRCHQGYWVNLAYVMELDYDEFVLRDGKRIAISRTYKDQARQAFFSQFK